METGGGGRGEGGEGRREGEKGIRYQSQSGQDKTECEEELSWKGVKLHRKLFLSEIFLLILI